MFKCLHVGDAASRVFCNKVSYNKLPEKLNLRGRSRTRKGEGVKTGGDGTGEEGDRERERSGHIYVLNFRASC